MRLPMKIIFRLKRRLYKLVELIIKELVDVNLSENKIIFTAEMNDGKVYDISTPLGWDEQNKRVLIETDYDEARYLKIPLLKTTDISINKDYTICRTIDKIKTEIENNKTDFYVIVSNDTLDKIRVNIDTVSYRDDVKGMICHYNGYKVLIDNSLGFGDVIFR